LPKITKLVTPMNKQVKLVVPESICLPICSSVDSDYGY